MKKTGLKMKPASIRTGGKIAAIVVVADGITIGAVTVASHNNDTKDKAPVTATETTIEPAKMETIMWATTSINVHAEASKDSDKLGTLAQGDTIVVLGDTTSEWVTVSYNGGTGYVKGSLLSSTEVAKATY